MMQQALPYRNWLSNAAVGSSVGSTAEMVNDDSKSVRKTVSENAVVVFARKGCCMCHVVKLLLHGHGVNPCIFDVDDQNESEVNKELSKIVGKLDELAPPPPLPAVFVGGELFGGLEEVMGAHISGALVPKLREARALWL